jgi:leucyl-tRNA synthetase
MAHWMPVSLYTGGAEHAVLHLLYSRFFVKALRDMGHLSFDEPFLALRNQGQILGADHQRMSKSRGNVVNPDDLVARYGADTVRLFLLFIGPWDQGGPWSSTGIEGVSRFLSRVWQQAQPGAFAERPTPAARTPGIPTVGLAGEVAGTGGRVGDAVIDAVESASRALRRTTHQAIQAVTKDYTAFHFNTAVSELMALSNVIGEAAAAGATEAALEEAIDTMLLLLAPMAPHLAEELWERRGRPYSIHQQPWPEADPAVATDELIELPVQVDGKLRDRLLLPPNTAAEEIERLALASERVQAYLGGSAPARVVQIPGRLVNVVTRRG